MNRFAYLTTGYAVKALSGLSKARIFTHGREHIPDGSIIFAVNHFTRIETLILPCYMYDLTGSTPIWSLADASLFHGPLKGYLDNVGAVSTRDPDRDNLIVKTLLNGEAAWIIFPEGRMVKSKKIVNRGRFMVSSEKGPHPPHTGAAALALRTEFSRQRLQALIDRNPDEAEAFMKQMDIPSAETVIRRKTYIVPVNITYYPLRVRENILSKMASNLMDDITDRTVEELMTEGTMLLSGVDIDIRIGPAIDIRPFLMDPSIRQDVESEEETCFEECMACRKVFRRHARTIMQQYMSAIYQMTTVNHDHLFASILKGMPFKKIDAADLKRRVFLAASQDLKSLNVFFHQSLKGDQIHLLTDDRYGKADDFFTVSAEKGALLESQDGWQKNRSFFARVFDFHKVRVGNPISVMANEVEPLKQLQKRVKRLSWLPRFWIRRKVVRLLMEKTACEYDDDYHDNFAEEISKPRDIGAPYLIRSRRRDIGVLLIHGYMAAPSEMKELADYLSRKGFACCVPRLKGHGTVPEDLADRSYHDWIDSVDAGYAAISTLCRQVVVGGFSTGSALALELAARIHGVKGVFSICPPRRLGDASLKKNLAVDIWKKLVEKVRRESERQPEFIENQPENPAVSYNRNPVSGIREIELLMDHIEDKLPEITAPALFIHSQRDPVASPDESRRIFEKIGSEDRQYILFNHERHGLLSGPDAFRVHQAVGYFIENLLQ